MNKKLICTLIAGVTFGVSAPVFADSYNHRGYDRYSSHFRGHDRDGFRDHNRHGYRGHDRYAYRDHDRYAYRDYDRHAYRGHDRYAYRGYAPRPVVVYERPYVVQRPVYVEQPVYQSQQSQGIGAIFGAAIGSIYDSQY